MGAVRDVGDRHVHEAVAPAADDQVGAARHARVHRRLGEARAVHRVGRVGGDRADEVARVEVAEQRLLAAGLEVVADALAQETADVGELLVAGGVVGLGVGQVLLTRALRDHQDRVALGLDSAPDVREQAVVAVELERHLGDQHEVGVVVGDRGVAGDEPRVAPHDLDDPDAVDGRLGLDLRGLDRLRGARVGGLEAEALADVRDVVVDRLRHADHCDPRVAGERLLRDAVRTVQRAVAADHEEDVDATALQRVDHDADVLRAARGAEHRAAALVDRLDVLGREVDRAEAVLGHEAGEPVAEAGHVSHAVVLVQLQHEGADDVVETGAQATARHDADPGLPGLEVDVGARAARLEGRHLVERQAAGAHELDGVVEQDAVVLADVVLVRGASADVRRER